MTKQLVIVGAGIAGLLAANMLRHHNPVIVEAQDSLPNNHHAVLRFRSSVVGDVLGIQFKRVEVLKATIPWQNQIADALSYSRKSSGRYLSDRSITREVSSSERWIAPPDLIERMAENVAIEYSVPWDFANPDKKVISTIPMPSLMSALSYPGRVGLNFSATDGWVVTATIANCDAYVSAYVPDPDYPFTRISITGDQLIVEGSGPPPRRSYEELAMAAAGLLGINKSWGALTDVEMKEQRYAKIVPIDEAKRREFIFWASTLQGRAFSLGRFATWRPRLLADDLVKDIRLIDGWIRSGSPGYDMEKHERRTA
jgi:hypothetical protein